MVQQNGKVMEQERKYVIVTGAAGFIGSAMTSYLNSRGLSNLILVDDFSNSQKSINLTGKQYILKVHREQFEEWMETHGEFVTAIYHLGARTDTTLQDRKIFKHLNLDYSKMVWEYCVRFNIPLVYASSAATYGNGDLGYKDNEAFIPELHPLNPYGESKNDFDIWALQQKTHPPFWYGMKFFNVYGPNEFHKGRMASVIFHAFRQIQAGGSVKLFRSHKPEYADGGQLRDFIYVKDVVAVCEWIMNSGSTPGIYNLGTGKARSFNDLVRAIFTALDHPVQIEYIDTPADIRDSYQYFTEADMKKSRAQGLEHRFYTLEEGIADYVTQYLLADTTW